MISLAFSTDGSGIDGTPSLHLLFLNAEHDNAHSRAPNPVVSITLSVHLICLFRFPSGMENETQMCGYPEEYLCAKNV